MKGTVLICSVDIPRHLDSGCTPDSRQSLKHPGWYGNRGQLLSKNTPSNTSYYHQSMTEPWLAGSQGTFDSVHSRMALPGVGLHPLKGVDRSLVALAKLGGWKQLVEMSWDGWNGGAKLRLFHDAMKQLMAVVTNGQGVDMQMRLAAMLESVGTTNLQHKIISVRLLGAKEKEEVQDLSLQNMFATASFAKDTLKKSRPIDVAGEDLELMPDALVRELKEVGGDYKFFCCLGAEAHRCLSQNGLLIIVAFHSRCCQ